MLRLKNVHPTDTVAYPGGIGTFKIGAANEGSKILIYNASPLSFQLDFYNGSTDTLHPWEANPWTVDADTKEIGWQIDTDSLNVVTPPINTIFLTLYGKNEQLTGTYPVSLPYQTSLGGGSTGTTTVSTNAIANDGNPAGTSIIESTVSGKASTTILTNDGLLNLLTLIAGTLTQLIKTQSVGNPLLLGAATTITEILGNLTVDGNEIVTGTSLHTGNTSLSTVSTSGLATLNSASVTNNETVGGTLGVTGNTTLTGTLATGTITANNGATFAGGDLALNAHNITSSNNIVATSVQTATLNEAGNANSWASVTNGGPTRLQSTGAGAQIAMQVPGGSTVLGIVANQMQLASTATFRLANGNQISGVSSFTGAGSGTFNHTYGSAPFFVIPMVSVVGSATLGYNTITATQVTITIGAALAFKCFCFG
jgi:hypothetical protein